MTTDNKEPDNKEPDNKDPGNQKPNTPDVDRLVQEKVNEALKDIS